MSDPERRRRRVRPARTPGGSTEPPNPTALTADVHDPAPAHTAPAHPPHLDPPDERRATSTDDRDTERALRGLIGAGASQLSISAALRARDAARPTAADLAEAAERVVLVRRNWVPRDGQR